MRMGRRFCDRDEADRSHAVPVSKYTSHVEASGHRLKAVICNADNPNAISLCIRLNPNHYFVAVTLRDGSAEQASKHTQAGHKLVSLIGDNLSTDSTRTTTELNLAVLKITHEVTRAKRN